MKHAIPVAVGALLVGAIVGSVGTRSLHAQQPAVTRTPLMQTDLEGVDGKEAVMFLAEIAPGRRAVGTTIRGPRSPTSYRGLAWWKSTARLRPN
jgi:hypothetical protein